AEGKRGRVYLSPLKEHEHAAECAKPDWLPEGSMVDDARAFTPYAYGLGEWHRLFTPRQLTTLTTLVDLIAEVMIRVEADASRAGMSPDPPGLAGDGRGARAYSEAIGVYLAAAISRLADFGCTLATWKASGEQVMHLFTRQAVPMTWDFAEANLLGDSAI